MINDTIIHNNKTYWNNHADFWFGTTALPQYGVKFPTEDELKLFGDVTGKKMLEICCGSGHSIKYHAERGAGELWGIDISQNQLDNAKKYLEEYGCAANLIYSSMEEMNLPQDYFDYVYSIYGIGWTTDLQETFNKIASSLPDGEYSATSSRQVGCPPCAARAAIPCGLVVRKQNQMLFTSGKFECQ